MGLRKEVVGFPRLQRVRYPEGCGDGDYWVGRIDAAWQNDYGTTVPVTINENAGREGTLVIMVTPVTTSPLSLAVFTVMVMVALLPEAISLGIFTTVV